MKRLSGNKVRVLTYGCQMNEHDSEVIAGLLSRSGFEVVGPGEDADIFVLNTCSVREHAEERVRGRINQLAAGGGAGRRPLLVVCGCMAQSRGVSMLRELPVLDVICGPHRLDRLPAMIAESLHTGACLVDVSGEEARFTAHSSLPRRRGSPVSAWVSIMRGCDNFCAYCIVPYVRGREVSRAPDDILREVDDLAGGGYREVTLLGQNVNSYRGEHEEDGSFCDFIGLLELIEEIEGIERIRFVTSHPKDVSDRLPSAMARLSKVCEHIHLPVQSGSDTVLARMNRKYTRGGYADIVRRLRREVPGIAITTDIIVGFPGETQEEFGETVGLIEEIRFDGAFIFKYSPRPRTAAAEMEDSVPTALKKERLHLLLEMQAETSRARNSALVGKGVEVLVEGRSPRNPSRLIGRTRDNRVAVFSGAKGDIGKIVRLEVREANAATLYCEKSCTAVDRPPPPPLHTSPGGRSGREGGRQS